MSLVFSNCDDDDDAVRSSTKTFESRTIDIHAEKSQRQADVQNHRLGQRGRRQGERSAVLISLPVSLMRACARCTSDNQIFVLRAEHMRSSGIHSGRKEIRHKLIKNAMMSLFISQQ